MRNVIDMALDFDPIYELEKMTGKNHHSEFTDDENGMALALNMFSGEAKKKILMNAKDTYWGIKWDDFISLIESHGFKQALKYDFVDNQWDIVKTEEAILYYDDNGFIIWAESYGGKDRINGGTMYGQIEVGKEFNRCDVLAHCSNGYHSDNHIHFSKDIREGLINTINKVKANSKPMRIWNSPEFLWFLDYTEVRRNDYSDYSKDITKSKIIRCPKEFQDIVGAYMKN